jgi:uncharacterized repeat protein (TIGR02543 family)
MQSAMNEDFEFAVKFDSAMSQKNQAQGVLIENDAQNFLRYNFAHDGSAYRIQAYTITNGNSKIRVNKAISIAPPMYLRVGRVGNTWELTYSGDGVSWTTAAGFTHNLAVSSYGVFVGNSAQSPAHTGLIDYFFNTVNPIIPEDDNRKLNITTAGDGTVEVDPIKANYACGEPVELTAVPSPGFRFASWGGDLSGNANPATVVMSESLDITANFVADAQYALTVTANGPGTVSKNPDKPFYDEGEEVILTAVPAADAGFVNWSGDASGSYPEITVIMDGDKTITANFAANVYTLSVSAGPNGSVTKTPDKATYAHGELVTLQATAAPGYLFTGWSGDLTGSANPASLIMDGDKNVTASFAEGGFAGYVPVIIR